MYDDFVNNTIKSSDEKDVKMKIKELKRLSSLAENKFKTLQFKTYAELIRSHYWEQAKRILGELNEINHQKICYFCNKNIHYNYFVIHHRKYDEHYIFNPKHIVLAHYQCHDDYHARIKRNKKNL